MKEGRKVTRPKLVYGVGINDADYPIKRMSWDGYKSTLEFECPYYKRWANMLRRCYSVKYQSTRPTYTNAYVCSDWLIFSNFKRWMEQQDWEGKALDKDLIIPGSKVYSPATCVFVDMRLNAFLTNTSNNTLLGVRSRKGKTGNILYYAVCSYPLPCKGYKQKKLSGFKSEAEAHEGYLKMKREVAQFWLSRVDNSKLQQRLQEIIHG